MSCSLVHATQLIYDNIVSGADAFAERIRNALQTPVTINPNWGADRGDVDTGAQVPD